jgi:hypothetical protein
MELRTFFPELCFSWPEKCSGEKEVVVTGWVLVKVLAKNLGAAPSSGLQPRGETFPVYGLI